MNVDILGNDPQQKNSTRSSPLQGNPEQILRKTDLDSEPSISKEVLDTEPKTSWEFAPIDYPATTSDTMVGL